jgi:hypothetical protein
MPSSIQINDFIGIFPDAVSCQTCDKIIEHFEYVSKLGWSQSRQTTEGSRYIDKDNDTYFLSNTKVAISALDEIIFDMDHQFTQEFVDAFWKCFSFYQDKYGVLESIGKLGFTGKIKIQKNKPGEGYHVWHCEQGTVATSSRVLLVILYLNDVEEGGETEFLYLHKRVKANKGTIVLCPGGFTHTHRGNPPLFNDKYIMNTWVQLIE